ncbi:hypothetical protein F5144DRAFT_595183 [Chaetomium tenue]|uniref:Uncharacterized protein n=1 Tax=Chaetomium tenue TaxID=1854479 RepID=A0ACB7NZ39_9PEZI|nr:hypothetical protein F5144DRAFT_595183 [Chaetomium globosum]
MGTRCRASGARWYSDGPEAKIRARRRPKVSDVCQKRLKGEGITTFIQQPDVEVLLRNSRSMLALSSTAPAVGVPRMRSRAGGPGPPMRLAAPVQAAVLRRHTLGTGLDMQILMGSKASACACRPRFAVGGGGFGNLGTETTEEFEWDDVNWFLSGVTDLSRRSAAADK